METLSLNSTPSVSPISASPALPEGWFIWGGDWEDVEDLAFLPVTLAAYDTQRCAMEFLVLNSGNAYYAELPLSHAFRDAIEANSLSSVDAELIHGENGDYAFDCMDGWPSTQAVLLKMLVCAYYELPQSLPEFGVGRLDWDGKVTQAAIVELLAQAKSVFYQGKTFDMTTDVPAEVGALWAWIQKLPAE